MKQYKKNSGASKGSFNQTPSEKEMSRYKDFGKLVHNYERATEPLYRRLLYRNRKRFLGLLLILIILYLVFEFG